MMKSKIHHVTVTQCELEYEGSVTIDSDLMKQANIHHNEQVHIFNSNNGNRFITYAIEGKAGSGVICINGPAAHLTSIDDTVIICAYATINDSDAKSFKPTVLLMANDNTVKEIKRS